MQRLHFSISIHAPVKKVWSTMLDDSSYRSWTEVFAPGSHYIGNWSAGSKMLFLAPDQSGKFAGMVSRIKENRPNEYVSIEHLGVVQDGKEDTSSDTVKQWNGAHENYTFQAKNGSTELSVEMDTIEEYRSYFENTWPQALQKLKELAER